MFWEPIRLSVTNEGESCLREEWVPDEAHQAQAHCNCTPTLPLQSAFQGAFLVVY